MKLLEKIKRNCFAESRYTSDNHGFSLIELIVVIAIMSILTGGVAFGVNMVFSRDSERCASALNDAISQTRMNAMTRPGDYTLTITERTDGSETVNVCDIKVNDTLVETIYLDGSGNSKKNDLEIKFKNSGSPLAFPVTIQFDKQKGNVSKITSNGTDCTSDEILCFNATAMRGNSSRNKCVQLITTTGKHSIESF